MANRLNKKPTSMYVMNQFFCNILELNWLFICKVFFTDRFGNPMKNEFEITIQQERVDLLDVRFMPKVDKNATLHVVVDGQEIAATPIEIEKGISPLPLLPLLPSLPSILCFSFLFVFSHTKYNIDYASAALSNINNKPDFVSFGSPAFFSISTFDSRGKPCAPNAHIEILFFSLDRQQLNVCLPKNHNHNHNHLYILIITNHLYISGLFGGRNLLLLTICAKFELD